MGFWDMFKPAPPPSIPSALPDAAKKQIEKGILPNLTSNRIFLRTGELCHYIDKSIYERRTVSKKRVRKSSGYSMPGLSSGSRFRTGGSNTTMVEDVKYDTCKGVLYITNQRIMFVGSQAGFGFEKDIDDLIAVVPFANCIELQFSKETLKLFVPDGNIPLRVLNMLK